MDKAKVIEEASSTWKDRGKGARVAMLDMETNNSSQIMVLIGKIASDKEISKGSLMGVLKWS